MIIECPGNWSSKLTHAPLAIGEKAPVSDPRVTDGCCDACARAMGAEIVCRWCEVERCSDGLCTGCEISLMTKIGPPSVMLTVYRQAGRVSCAYDGAGAILRLRAAMRYPEFRAFALERLKAEVAR